MRVRITKKLRLLSFFAVIFCLSFGLVSSFLTRRPVTNTPPVPIINTELHQQASTLPLASHIDSSLVEQKLRNSYVDARLQQLSLEEKVGQLFIWRAQGTRITPGYADLLKNTHAGGVIMMGNNISPDIKQFSNELQSLSSQVPLFIAIDQEGGTVKRIMSDPNPGPVGLAQLSDDKACSTMQNTAKILKEDGVNVNFGIVGDIAWGTDSYMASRSYGNNAGIVSNKVAKAIECSPGILSTVKHYPGHGRTSVNSHLALPEIQISYDEWTKTDAVPFKTAIDKNVDLVMTGHLKIPAIDDKPASLSKKHIDILRKFGFQGIVVTDDLGMLSQSHIDPYYALDNAVDAGSDLLLYVDAPVPPQDLYNHVLTKARNGEISQDRINESVKRILGKKFEVLVGG